MDRRLGQFIHHLRGRDVRISTSESIDAMLTAELVGLHDRSVLRTALALVLSKSEEEKGIFFDCFDRFFKFDAFSGDNEPGDDAGGAGIGPHDSSSPEDLGDESGLARMLLEGDRTGLAISMAEAAEAAELGEMSFFMQKGKYVRRIMSGMGLESLDRTIRLLREDGSPESEEKDRRLSRGKQLLLEEVKDYVEGQFVLHAEEKGVALREETLREVKLSHIDKRDFRMLHELVRKMAKRLISLNSRRRKRYRLGQIDIRRTLMKNMSHDAVLIDMHWKTRKRDRPSVFVICDVSGSVRAVAKFLLMFLYSMNEVLPRIRTFAFSSALGEVTDLFTGKNVETAIAETLYRYGNGLTDYGRAFSDFCELCLDNLDHRSSVIILGDGRNNQLDLQIGHLEKIYRRCRQVIWLNPEERSRWGSGDSEMRKIMTCCHFVEVCNSLRHLERVVSKFLRTG
jgi:hypothetical protein